VGDPRKKTGGIKSEKDGKKGEEGRSKEKKRS